jgi:hypothetical protein
MGLRKDKVRSLSQFWTVWRLNVVNRPFRRANEHIYRGEFSSVSIHLHIPLPPSRMLYNLSTLSDHILVITTTYLNLALFTSFLSSRSNVLTVSLSFDWNYRYALLFYYSYIAM